MQILLCAATVFEIEQTISYIKEKKLEKNVNVLISGVGMMATTYALTKELFTNEYDLVLQAGIAGTVDKEIELGKCVVIENEYIGDLGVNENGQFKTIFDLGFEKKDQLPWTNGALKNPSSEMLSLAALPIINGVTVDEISTSDAKINYFQNELNASIETMEGAALHYVCIMQKLPFLQLRSISNLIGERDKTKWLMKDAIDNVNLELQRIIEKTM